MTGPYGFDGSEGVTPFVAPGAVLSLQVPRVASSYTVVVAGEEGPTSWTVEIEDVVTPATGSTTTRADGVTVIENSGARAAITIPGMRYADAQRVLVIGRSDDGALRRVAAGVSIGG